MHGAHESDEIFGELQSSQTNHRSSTLLSVERVSRLDELRVGIKKRPPTSFAIQFGLVNHVQPMSALREHGMLHGEVLPTQTPE
jgi:hypothetical protein